MALKTFKATLATKEPIALRAGDTYKSRFTLTGQLDYSGKFTVVTEHEVYNETDEVWEEYGMRKPKENGKKAFSYEVVNATSIALQQQGLIDVIADGGLLNCLTKVMALGAMLQMLEDADSWYTKAGVQITDLDIEIVN